jgi:hypothetical protein
MMGGPQAIIDLANALPSQLAAVASAGGATSTANFFNDLGAAVAATLTGSGNFTTITHDRMYVPPTAKYLTFQLVEPFVLQSGNSITVTFYRDVGGSLGTAEPETVQVPFAIFTTSTFSVPVPEDVIGQMATFSITDNGFQGDDVLQYKSGAFTVVASVAQAISEVFFLENVQFAQNPMGIVPTVGVVSAASSLGITTGDLTLDQVNQVATEARQYWIDSGLFPDAAAALAPVQVVVGQLSDGDIGGYANGTITIDQSALGVGWYTGLDNSEFTTCTGASAAAASGKSPLSIQYCRASVAT